jgi:hypothetical protein
VSDLNPEILLRSPSLKALKTKPEEDVTFFQGRIERDAWEEFRQLAEANGQTLSGRVRLLILRDIKAARPEPVAAS